MIRAGPTAGPRARAAPLRRPGRPVRTLPTRERSPSSGTRADHRPGFGGPPGAEGAP